MMTKRPQDEAVQSGIRAHLTRVDRDLWRAGISAEERGEIIASITTQIEDLLAEHCANRLPNTEDLAAVLQTLDPPRSYMNDTPNTRNLLGLLLRRLWIGHPITLAVNNNGKRQIYWWRLTVFFLICTLTMISGMVLFVWLLGIDMTWLMQPLTLFILVLMNLAIFTRIYRTPVTDLPLIRADNP